MNRYEVHVHVVYKVDAASSEDAYRKINEGAEFPVMPYDDNTYCDSTVITDVKQLSATKLAEEKV
jgi:ABC-type molybdate transport system substrate-binding protein